MPPDFDGQRALLHARAISYPRMVGSAGEARAREYIRSTLAGLGYDAKVEPFRFFPSFPMTFAKGVAAASLAGLALALVFEPIHPRFAALIALFTGFIAVRGSRRFAAYSERPDLDHSAKWWLRSLFPRAGLRAESANVTSATPGDAEREVVLLAHYDTKSQNISIVTRIACVAALTLGIFVVAGRVALDLIAPSLAESGAARGVTLAVYLLALAGGIGVLSLRVSDRSPGALDNAGSVGVLLHLAELFAQSAPPAGWRIRFVLTGAEELGLAGANAFALALDREPAARRVHLNLDGVGGGGRLYCTMETALFSGNASRYPGTIALATGAANDIGAPIRVLRRVIGGAADHFPLVQRGFPALTIGQYSRASWTVHTDRDRPELLSAAALAEAGRLVLRMIERAAEAL